MSHHAVRVEPRDLGEHRLLIVVMALTATLASVLLGHGLASLDIDLGAAPRMTQQLVLGGSSSAAAATGAPPLVEPLPRGAAEPVASLHAPESVVAHLPDTALRWLGEHDWKVEWLQGPGPGRVAEARYDTRTIVIWHTSDLPDEIWAGALVHELGHAVSYTHFSDRQMDEWNEMRGLSSWRWVEGTADDFAVGEGDFAEAFMSYLLGHPVRSAGGPLDAQARNWIAANTPFAS